MSTSVGSKRLAAGITVASGLLLLAGVAATLAAPDELAGEDVDVWGTFSFAFTIAAFSGVGGVIASRRPENVIGWLMSAIGLLFAVVVACSSGSAWALETGNLPEPVGEWISVPSNSWVLALGLIGTELPLRLPDGRLLSPRWRKYSLACRAAIVASFIAMAVQPGRVMDVAGTANPVGIEGAEPFAGVFLLVLLGFFGATASLFLRYRRADAHDRVQLRWVAFGGAVFFFVYFASLIPQFAGVSEHSTTGDILTAFSQAAFAALPIAIGAAILRHGLYDIDVVINRALVYAVLTATLAAAYLASVLLLQLALGGLTSDNGLAVAGSTLAVAALFRPARARIQAGVDRRFFRRRYDARRTLESFSASLRDQVELGALDTELRAVVRETLQPAHVSLWLREAGR